MDISKAKEQIKNTVRIYLQKDALGKYKVPLVHQRPVFLLGAPGLGKTAILQQIADEMDIGLVSYSMTHHTRQSALGLPMIVKKEFDGMEYNVSEYTMSEIIASVYNCMEKTGKRQGILFLDEINCVSETLSPAMLLFLQYKVFGGHQLPEGWIVVTAGNPPRYNKSVREFDSATRDRLKVIEIEPDYDAWKRYALQKNLSRAVVSFLDIRQDAFYVVQNTVDGMSVVTPRAWEDLSECIGLYEDASLPVDEGLIAQYLQNSEIARDFAIYYDLYQKYRAAYDIPMILSGLATPETIKKAQEARLDERLSLVGLLLEAVFNDMNDCTVRHDALAELRKLLIKRKSELLATESDQTPIIIAQLHRDLEELAETVHGTDLPALERAAVMLNGWTETASATTENTAFSALQGLYKSDVEALKADVSVTQHRIGAMLDFIKAAFGKGNELSLAVNDLTVNPEATAFVGQFLSTDLFEASHDLMLDRQRNDLLDRITLEGL